MRKSPNNDNLLKARIWLHVMLSYMFIGAIIATLVCAYLQEINEAMITVSLLVTGLYGGLKAEKIRKTSGLVNYSRQLKSHRDLA